MPVGKNRPVAMSVYLFFPSMRTIFPVFGVGNSPAAAILSSLLINYYDVLYLLSPSSFDGGNDSSSKFRECTPSASIRRNRNETWRSQSWSPTLSRQRRAQEMGQLRLG